MAAVAVQAEAARVLGGVMYDTTGQLLSPSKFFFLRSEPHFIQAF
jgi:hypothetical protein